MKSLKPSKKWVLAAIGFLLALLILKIVLLLTTKPKITVDYVAEYNKITRPVNYDPNDNAAPYYQKVFDAFVEMPNELWSPYIDWPTDYDNTEQALLENWLASNSQAFEYFKEGVNKAYYWLEKHTDKDDFMLKMLFPEVISLNHLIEAVLWKAKLAAYKGRPQTAFENIIDCYRAGCQKCRTPSSLTSQLNGVGFKKAATKNALLILDKTQVDSSALKSFQTALQAEFDRDTYVPDFTAEKLYLYDALQRTFIDNGRGTGRLAWSVTKGFAIIQYGWSDIKMQLNCFFGPTRNQTVEQTEKVVTISNQMMTRTPWQVKSEGRDYFEEIEKINNSNFFLRINNVSSRGISHSYYETRAQTEALITVLAILRFKNDKGQFPATLGELVSAGYLESVPMDPYSNGPLVYKLTEDNFKLYSVGENFVDDGGSSEAKKIQVSTYEYYYERPPNIVYWPVKNLKRLRYESATKRQETEEADLTNY